MKKPSFTRSSARLLSAALALLMLFTLLPQAVMAATVDELSTVGATALKYTFNSSTGTFVITSGTYADPTWPTAVTKDSVKSVTTNGIVTFTGSCADLFKDLKNCTSMNLRNVNTSSVTNMSGMFYALCDTAGRGENPTYCTITFGSNFTTANATTMKNMFRSAHLTTLDLSKFNTSKVTSMDHMFYCIGITDRKLDTSSFNTSNVTSMNCMFAGIGIDELTLTSFNTAKVTNFGSMFYGGDIKKIDISSFTFGSNAYTGQMFRLNGSIRSLTVPSGFAVTSSMYLNNGSTNSVISTSQKGWVKSTATSTVVSGSDTYAVISAPTAKTTYVWRYYPITWKQDDGTAIDTSVVLYNTKPTHSNPTKAATAQYTYSFKAWSPTVANATAPATYTATYNSTVNKYNITWKDGDGNTLKTDSVAYGSTPSYSGTTPTKTQTAEYTYTFNNTWSPTIAKVTGAATYTANFTSTSRVISYSLTNNGTTLVINSGTYANPVWPSSLSKSSIESIQSNGTVNFKGDCSNLFSGFTNCTSMTSGKFVVTDVTKFSNMFNKSGFPNLDLSSWSINSSAAADMFNGADNLYRITVPKNFAITSAMKLNNGYYYISRSREGWRTLSNETKVSGNDTVAVIPAQSSATTFVWRKYPVFWRDTHGRILTSYPVYYDYNTMPTISQTPSYDGTAQYDYTFAGWSPTVVNATAPATYTPIFTSTLRKYDIKWVDGDGNTLKTEQVEYGTTPSYSGDTPTKTPTADTVYTHSGWSPVVSAVTGSATYTAQFDESTREYTVTWKNEDGSTLKTEQVAYGETPAYSGTPEKARDARVHYDFAGWSPVIAAVSGDAEYTATYNAVEEKLHAGHSLTLGGDVGVNFYLNLSAEEVAQGVTVHFTWLNGEQSYDYTVQASDLKDSLYKVSVHVPAAEMSYQIHAEVSINGILQDETDDYSVRDYALTIIGDPDRFGDDLVNLAKAMLDYGAKAQTAFDRTDVILANDGVDYTMQAVSSADFDEAVSTANAGSQASDMRAETSDLGLSYYGTSLVYLTRSTLRHYYTVTDQAALDAVKDGTSFTFSDSKAPFVYFEHENIAAADLDTLQAFTIGGKTYYFSALDFAKGVIERASSSEANKNLAAATYWYNHYANEYFDNLGGN